MNNAASLIMCVCVLLFSACGAGIRPGGTTGGTTGASRGAAAADMKIGGRSTTVVAVGIEAEPDATDGDAGVEAEPVAADGGFEVEAEPGTADGDAAVEAEPDATDGDATEVVATEVVGAEENGNNNAQYAFAASGFDALSSKKTGWGVKLNGNRQPEVPAAIRTTLDDYNAAFIGSPDAPFIYLTFDLGYETGYTEFILDTLKDEGVKAAFFIDGHYLSSQTDIVNRVIADGHIAANHSLRHRSFPDLTDDELAGEIFGLESRFLEATGVEMSKYVRPPGGEYSERSLAVTASLGFTTVLWSFAYVDYDLQLSYTADYAYNKIADNLHNGAVILLHTVKKENADVLARVIGRARGDGYTFDTLDNLFIYTANNQTADPGGQDNVPNYT